MGGECMYGSLQLINADSDSSVSALSLFIEHNWFITMAIYGKLFDLAKECVLYRYKYTDLHIYKST